ncbi:MAG: YXWGXW repeat-containing protein [Proteobacteria bacterium]|nr:YXWGXW repeat-containing protein [Pseudomonadota bacterium]
MRNLNRRGMLTGVVLAASLAAVTAPAMAQEIIITREAPPMRTEVIPVLPRERAEIDVWQPGYWRWNGHEHVWHEGRYVPRPRPHAEWVPAHYDRRPGGWVFVDGHWR